tara:strand:+ start:26 stop:625 length:600 start_codon:yes stop_codon:yes gene_type:complete
MNNYDGLRRRSGSDRDREMFDRVTNKIGPTMRNVGSGSASDREIDSYRSAMRGQPLPNSDREMFDRITNKVGPAMRPVGSGSTSDKEFNSYRSAMNMEDLGALPEYTGDGDPMDDSLRAEGPTADRLERLISLYGIPFEVAIAIADYMPPFDLIEGGEEEERDIALDLQNMLLNELSGNVDKTIEASPVEMDMRENYTR